MSDLRRWTREPVDAGPFRFGDPPVSVKVTHHMVDVPEEPGAEPVELGTITRHYENGRLVHEEREGEWL